MRRYKDYVEPTPVSAERARYLLRNMNGEWFRFNLSNKQHPRHEDGITDGENAFIKQLWRLKGGQTYEQVITRIAQGKPPAKRNLSFNRG